MTDSPFKVGDIVVCKIQFAGLSYHYMFGKVVKLSAIGRLRVRELEADVIKEEENQSGMGSVTTVIKPSDREVGEIYMGGQGTTFKYRFQELGKNAPTKSWQCYDPDVVYDNYSSNGD